MRLGRRGKQPAGKHGMPGVLLILPPKPPPHILASHSKGRARPGAGHAPGGGALERALGLETWQGRAPHLASSFFLGLPREGIPLGASFSSPAAAAGASGSCRMGGKGGGRGERLRTGEPESTVEAHAAGTAHQAPWRRVPPHWWTLL